MLKNLLSKFCSPMAAPLTFVPFTSNFLCMCSDTVTSGQVILIQIRQRLREAVNHQQKLLSEILSVIYLQYQQRTRVNRLRITSSIEVARLLTYFCMYYILAFNKECNKTQLYYAIHEWNEQFIALLVYNVLRVLWSIPQVLYCEYLYRCPLTSSKIALHSKLS